MKSPLPPREKTRGRVVAVLLPPGRRGYTVAVKRIGQIRYWQK